MKTIIKYIEQIKSWSFLHPLKFIFILGFISGFIESFINSRKI